MLCVNIAIVISEEIIVIVKQAKEMPTKNLAIGV